MPWLRDNSMFLASSCSYSYLHVLHKLYIYRIQFRFVCRSINNCFLQICSPLDNFHFSYLSSASDLFSNWLWRGMIFFRPLPTHLVEKKKKTGRQSVPMDVFALLRRVTYVYLHLYIYHACEMLVHGGWLCFVLYLPSENLKAFAIGIYFYFPG